MIRSVLDVNGLAEVFESLGTSAGYGPTVSPRVIRRLAGDLGVPTRQVIVVTARERVATRLRTAHIATVLIGGPEDFADVPDIVADLTEGPFTP